MTYLSEEERLKQNIRFMKSERRINQKVIKAQKYVILLLFVALVLAVGVLSLKITNLNGTVDQLRREKTVLLSSNTKLYDQFLEENLYLTAMSNVAYQLEEENQILIDDNLSLASDFDVLNKDYQELSEREELYDKYEFAIIRSNHTRTDIRYEDFKHLEEIAEEEGISQDGIDLCLSFVMNESNGLEKAANANSSARGYGQLLSSTGRFCYTSLMGHNSYNHEVIALDGPTNLEMSLRYLAYLDEYNHHNAVAVVRNYCGGWNDAYVAKLNRYLSRGTTPTSVQTLRIHDE